MINLIPVFGGNAEYGNGIFVSVGEDPAVNGRQKACCIG